MSRYVAILPTKIINGRRYRVANGIISYYLAGDPADVLDVRLDAWRGRLSSRWRFRDVRTDPAKRTGGSA